jgi:hypothetical protein
MKRLQLFPLTTLLCSVLVAGCSTGQNKERLLSASGFHTVVPTTQKQVAQLKTLPQLQVIPVTKKGKTIFMFADSKRNILLVGNQKQYQQFQQYSLQYHIQQDKVEAASLNADAAEWDGWGGWGGMGGFWGPGFY